MCHQSCGLWVTKLGNVERKRPETKLTIRNADKRARPTRQKGLFINSTENVLQVLSEQRIGYGQHARMRRSWRTAQQRIFHKTDSPNTRRGARRRHEGVCPESSTDSARSLHRWLLLNSKKVSPPDTPQARASTSALDHS